jgi:1-acyl-sn-glycerol-3-phosphate acyltransferase
LTKKGSPGRRRHELAYRITRFLITPYFTWRFNMKADRQPNLPSPYVVIANHVTELDFLFIGKVFKEPLTFVAGEALLRARLLGSILTHLYGVIVKRKGTADARTTMGMLRRLKEGRNVCLFAEGNTTFDGRTDRIPEATGSMIKAVKAGLITCRIEGAFFSMPRWGRGIRRGQTSCRIVNCYTTESLAGLSAMEINTLLRQDLQADAYDDQEKALIPFNGKKIAEGIEHVLYLCPGCGGQGTISGRDDKAVCNACGLTAVYSRTGFFVSRNPFPGIREWVDWQKEELGGKLRESGGGMLLHDPELELLIQDEQGELQLFAAGEMGMSQNSLQIGGFETPVSDITGLEIYRKNTLLFTLRDGRHFQTKPAKGFNALKYRDAYRFITE